MAREQRDVAPEPHGGFSEAAEPFLHDPPAIGDGSHVTLGPRQRAVVTIAALALFVAALAAPLGLLTGAYWTFFSVFLISASIRLAAALTPRADAEAPALPDDDLPNYTLIIPLYREAEVVAELMANLQRIDYPRDRLQALIVLEADDADTRMALRETDLPLFAQVLIAPAGEPRTKPRACNVALDWARGELTVIYDAEDAPHPLQLREAAARFAAEGPRLACVQAPLRIEAPDKPAFIPHQFRLEYAGLFEVMLPAYARWGLPFPLGGTSNHFRTSTLRAIGGWDAHNVTEDADVGFRLARSGHRLGVITRPTLETAPTTLGQWGPQRARWIKGHLQTLAVHSRRATRRDPRTLAAMLLTLALPLAASNLHAPAMAAAILGLGLDLLSDGEASFASAHLTLYAFGWSASAICCAVGTIRAGGRPSFLHLFGMAGYWPMWVIASPRALWQFFFAPHRWDKTQHAPRTGRPLP